MYGGIWVWEIVARRVCHGFHCDSSDRMLDVRLPRWFVHQSFPDRHELERREEGHLTMQSCLLISSLPPTRIKSYLLTTFWSPNQYYYRPNIETPRLCHHQCLLAGWWPRIMGCTPVVTSSSPTWSQQCFIVSVFYVLSTAISALRALVHNNSVHIIPLPGLYFVGPGPVAAWHSCRKGLRLVWGPCVLLGLWHSRQWPSYPRCQIRPGPVATGEAGRPWKGGNTPDVQTLTTLWAGQAGSTRRGQIWGVLESLVLLQQSTTTQAVSEATSAVISQWYCVKWGQWLSLSSPSSSPERGCHHVLRWRRYDVITVKRPSQWLTLPCHIPCHTRQD